VQSFVRKYRQESAFRETKLFIECWADGELLLTPLGEGFHKIQEKESGVRQDKRDKTFTGGGGAH